MDLYVLFYFNGAIVSTFEALTHIHFHYIDIFHIFFKKFTFCVPQKKESHDIQALERHKSE